MALKVWLWAARVSATISVIYLCVANLVDMISHEKTAAPTFIPSLFITFGLLPFGEILIHLMLSCVIQTERPFQKSLLVSAKFIVQVVHLAFSISGIHLKVGLMFRNCSIIFLMSAHGDRFVDKATEFVEVILIQCLCSIIHCLVKLELHDLGSTKFVGVDLNGALTYSFTLLLALIMYSTQNSRVLRLPEQDRRDN